MQLVFYTEHKILRFFFSSQNFIKISSVDLLNGNDSVREPERATIHPHLFSMEKSPGRSFSTFQDLKGASRDFGRDSLEGHGVME